MSLAKTATKSIKTVAAFLVMAGVLLCLLVLVFIAIIQALLS